MFARFGTIYAANKNKNMDLSIERNKLFNLEPMS